MNYKAGAQYARAVYGKVFEFFYAFVTLKTGLNTDLVDKILMSAQEQLWLQYCATQRHTPVFPNT